MFPLPRRWPETLVPDECRFDRPSTANVQRSPRTNIETILVSSPRLWKCSLSFYRPCDSDIQELTAIVDALSAQNAAIEIWNFHRPFVRGSGKLSNNLRIAPVDVPFRHVSTDYPFQHAGIDVPWTYTRFPTVAATAKGSKTVVMSGFAANDRVALSGDYIQISNRLYILARDIISNSAGQATVYLTTPLLKATAAAERVYLDRAACQMRMVEKSWQRSRSADEAFVSLSVDFVETRKDF